MTIMTFPKNKRQKIKTKMTIIMYPPTKKINQIIQIKKEKSKRFMQNKKK